MSNYFIKLEKYVYLEETTESLIIFKIFHFNEFITLKKICYECNPLFDVELLNLRNMELMNAIKKIQKIITNGEYKNKFLNPLVEFRNDLIREFFPEAIRTNPTIQQNNV